MSNICKFPRWNPERKLKGWYLYQKKTFKEYKIKLFKRLLNNESQSNSVYKYRHLSCRNDQFLFNLMVLTGFNQITQALDDVAHVGLVKR